MEYQNIKWQKEEGYGIITLNRPKALNALSRDMLREIEDVLALVQKDNNLNVVIVTGGPRADGRPCFSAGGDLKQAPDPNQKKPEQIIWDTLFSMITDKNATGLAGTQVSFEDWGRPAKIIIGAIDGVCTAGGLELALGCDIILVAETAQISDLHMKNLGLIGGAGSCTRLARRIGVAKAIELCCTCDIIDGKEAHRIGFANQVYPAAQLMEKAVEMAKKIAVMRPEALAMAKATCRAIYDMDYTMSLRYADACSMALHLEEEKWRAQRKIGNP